MARLNPKIWKKLVERTKGQIKESSIRTQLSRIRGQHPELTLNAAAEIFARKKNFTIARYLTKEDRDSLKTIKIEKVTIKSKGEIPKKKIIEIARFPTENKFLQAHINEINRTYTFGCYTACFILCRKVLENLIVQILEYKYPNTSRDHRKKYFDFTRNRFLDFNVLLKNLRSSSPDFGTEKKIIERIYQLAVQFKERADEMTHSLYHISTKKEIDEINYQRILDLIIELANKIQLKL